MKCLDKNHLDRIGVKANVYKALEAIVKRFRQSSYECTKNIYKNLKMLHLLQQIEEFSHIQFRGSEHEIYKPEFIMNKWKYQDEISSCEFNHREIILAQRLTMLQSATLGATRKVENVSYGFQQMMLQLVSECREEGFNNLGIRYAAKLRQMTLSKQNEGKAMIEEAELNWSRGETDIAQHLTKTVIDMKLPSFTHARALRMMGVYLAETRSEDTKTIFGTYLEKSTLFFAQLKKADEKTVEGTEWLRPHEERERLDLQNRKSNYHAMAKYADREYQQIEAYKKSNEFNNKLNSLDKNRKILDDMKHRYATLSPDERKSYTVLNKSLAIDEADVNSTNKECEDFLHLAIETYIQCVLHENGEESSTIFRLFGFWFANMSDETILKELREHIDRIPSYKFIALMPQITAHLNSDVIKETIEQIVTKCALEHPHHVLPKVLALVNAFKDDDILNTATKSSSPRTDAATKLLQQLKQNQLIRDIIIQMEKVYEALIRFAYVETKSSGLISDPIGHLRDLNLVHCPTVHLPISISKDYKETIVGIRRWRKAYSGPGGINAPKRIECIGSNGRQYSQLLKGKDDLRQDAVMQQVFNIMNDMLAQSNVTKKDRLHTRTYIIVPLSQRSGILEWCQNTMPLSEYLVGSSKNKGAHQRFRPNDWTPKTCREKLSQTKIREKSLEQIHKNFMDICKHIKPVLHHFFFEYFHSPGVWFERRMAYAHSLATTSMIGYILGIGDRHPSNILIDNTTAELIHIDFGIAFEQGKCLPTNELIPFRLTRDMVSALGPSGVEGVFRKSCEKTMEVLRQNKTTILTIVEVLLHDPLYAWSLTSDQASRRQQTDIQINKDEDPNTMAERTLWRLEEKLDGKHVSRSDATSVKRHVEILTKEATNDRLLCRLFVGWQPYL